MADNYLENKFEQLQARQGAKPVKRVNVSLDTLLKRNRSYRGYDTSWVVTLEQLKELAAVSCFCGSGQNRQQLRFRLVAGADSDKVLPLIKLGAALPQEHLPKPGTEPRAFIVVCSTGPENKVVDIDLGIAAQSILLKAVEKGLNGIFILNFNADALQQALDLPLRPLAVIAIGKGAESIFLKPVAAGEDLNYYRKEGVHYVPKLQIDDLLV